MDRLARKATFCEAHMFYYGSTKAEAAKAWNEFDESMKQALIDGYKYQIKLATICD